MEIAGHGNRACYHFVVGSVLWAAILQLGPKKQVREATTNGPS